MRADLHKLLWYVLVGGLNTALGYAAYAGFILAGAPIWLAVAGANILSFFFNFFSYGGLTICGLGPLAAQALLIPALVAIGFFGLRLCVFTSPELTNLRKTL